MEYVLALIVHVLPVPSVYAKNWTSLADLPRWNSIHLDCTCILKLIHIFELAVILTFYPYWFGSNKKMWLPLKKSLQKVALVKVMNNPGCKLCAITSYGICVGTYWCLYRHQCDLPERFGKKDLLVIRIAKDTTSWRNVTSWRCIHKH